MWRFASFVFRDFGTDYRRLAIAVRCTENRMGQAVLGKNVDFSTFMPTLLPIPQTEFNPDTRLSPAFLYTTGDYLAGPVNGFSKYESELKISRN